MDINRRTRDDCVFKATAGVVSTGTAGVYRGISTSNIAGWTGGRDVGGYLWRKAKEMMGIT